jgi:hypothetical protein
MDGWLIHRQVTSPRVEKNEWRSGEARERCGEARTIHSDISTNDKPINRFKKVLTNKINN